MDMIDRKRQFTGAAACLMAVTLILPGCRRSTTDTAPPEPKTSHILRSAAASSAPVIDGAADDMVWDKAEPLVLKTVLPEGGKTKGPDVTLKSVNTGNRVYLLVSWPDAVVEDGTMYWTFDGTRWSRDLDGDRVSFLWNIDHSIRDFDKQGCASVCHADYGEQVVDKKRRMRAARDTTAYIPRGDVWKWAPGIMQDYETVSDGVFQATPLSPRSAQFIGQAVIIFDNGEAGTKTWWTRNSRNPNIGSKTEPYPYWRVKPGITLEKPPFPFQHEMEFINDYSVFRAGDRIPVIMRFDLTDPKNTSLFPNGKPEGSSIDITGQARWQDGRWTLEISRLKDTKHNDDVLFKKKTGQDAYYTFGLAVFVDKESLHYTSEPAALVFENGKP